MRFFDLIDMGKVKPKNYVTGRWVFTIKTDKQGNFFKAMARWVARWQPAKVGIFFTLISKQPFVRAVF